MRRSVLLTLSLVGVIICLVGGTGLFAALTDTADTGTNTITTGSLPGSADLQLAAVVDDPGPGSVMCGTYAEDLASGLFAVASGTPPFSASNGICVRNVGSQAVSLTVYAIDVADVDTDCTGDEAVSDVTCGGGAAGSGDLSGVTSVNFYPTDCAGNTTGGTIGQPTLTDLATPHALSPSVASNGEVCYYVEAGIGAGITSTENREAQSDSITWRFRFEGTALP